MHGIVPTGPILEAGCQALQGLAEGGIDGSDLTALQTVLTRADELSAALSAQVIRNAKLAGENRRMLNRQPALRELTMDDLDDMPPGSLVKDAAQRRWAKSDADEHDRSAGICRQVWHDATGREVGVTKLLGDYGPVTAG